MTRMAPQNCRTYPLRDYRMIWQLVDADKQGVRGLERRS